MYMINDSTKRTIRIFDGYASPSVTIRCESADWFERMVALVSPYVADEHSKEPPHTVVL